MKLILTQEQSDALLSTQQAFVSGCNAVVPFVIENRCWNRVALHHQAYYALRKSLPMLGSQMVCNAIKKVSTSYQVLKIKRGAEVPPIEFRQNSSVHYDKRTYTLKGDTLTLFSVNGRIKCRYSLGEFQREYLQAGVIKEGELTRKGWFFNLVLDLPETKRKETGTKLSVDLGENNLAVTSNGTIFGGGKLRHKRDTFLSRRKKLQSNGSKSAKRCLRRISGKERRCVKETNHIVSKAVIEEATKLEVDTIIMEELTNIRERIKGNKRMRSRLHRWSWHQFQLFLEYKAKAKGIDVIRVNPAYTSQTCSNCEATGEREKHRFSCQNCGSYQHSDRNAALNLLKLGESVVSSTAQVNVPMVAAIG